MCHNAPVSWARNKPLVLDPVDMRLATRIDCWPQIRRPDHDRFYLQVRSDQVDYTAYFNSNNSSIHCRNMLNMVSSGLT